MRILITGGTGYLGRVMSEYFLDLGYNVRVLSNIISNNLINHKNIEYLKGNILSASDVDKACKGIDIIIHLAALDANACKDNPEEGLKVNAIGTRNIILAASRNNIKKFIYISTIQVYGLLVGSIDETTPVAPRNDYAISKLIGEYYCQSFSGNTNFTILRLSNGYGYSRSENGRSLVVNDLSRQCFLNNEMIIHAKGIKRNFVSLNDIINAINIIIKSPEETKNQVYNVGGKDTLSIYEVAEKVAKAYYELYEKNIPIKIESETKDDLNNDNFMYLFKKISALGYTPKYSVDDEIKKIFNNIESEKNG